MTKLKGKLLGIAKELSSQLQSDFSELPEAILLKDPAARSKLEIILLYPGFKALLAHRVAHALWQRQWHFQARALSEAARIVTGIEIHPGAKMGRRVVIDHGMGVVVGETAVVEDDVTIYQGVTLGGTQHVASKRHPTIRQGATIGVGASVLGDITIGAGARIGAGSVVLKNVPPDVSVGGVPAVPLKQSNGKEVKQPRAVDKNTQVEVGNNAH